MSASVFSAEGGGHHRGESKRKRRNSENKKIEAQEEGKEQKKIMAGRGRADSVGSSSEDETDANGRSVKKQLLSFWLTMEEKEKSEGSGFVRVQQQGRANKGPTGGRGHPGGLKHRSRSFDNKNDFLDELTSSSPPSTKTDQGDTKEHHLTVGSPSSGSSARRGRGHHHHHPLNTRGGSGGRGLQTFHARNHSFSSPMPFHLTTATTATSTTTPTARGGFSSIRVSVSSDDNYRGSTGSRQSFLAASRMFVSSSLTAPRLGRILKACVVSCSVCLCVCARLQAGSVRQRGKAGDLEASPRVASALARFDSALVAVDDADVRAHVPHPLARLQSIVVGLLKEQQRGLCPKPLQVHHTPIHTPPMRARHIMVLTSSPVPCSPAGMNGNGPDSSDRPAAADTTTTM